MAERADGHMSRHGKLDEWIPGPFVVMTLGQHCHTCKAYIEPGAAGYKSADGWVYCAGHSEVCVLRRAFRSVLRAHFVADMT